MQLNLSHDGGPQVSTAHLQDCERNSTFCFAAFPGPRFSFLLVFLDLGSPQRMFQIPVLKEPLFSLFKEHFINLKNVFPLKNRFFVIKRYHGC